MSYVIRKKTLEEYFYKYFIIRVYDKENEANGLLYEIRDFICKNKDFTFTNLCLKIDEKHENKISWFMGLNIEYDMETGNIYINKKDKCLPSIIISISIYK